MFYPEYVEMDTEILGIRMEEEMTKFLDDLPCHIVTAINSLCAFLFYFLDVQYIPNV